MINVQEIKELIKALDESSVDEIKFEQEGTKLVLKKQSLVQAVQTPQVVSQAAPAISPVQVKTEEQPPQVEQKSENQTKETNQNVHTISSPMVGTFYSAPSPDSDPYVKTGDKVSENTVVCIVEAMKLMNEIEAEVNGKIIEILAENGELVEYGQPLFVVELT